MKFNSVINWAQSHPWKTALRAVWLVANFIFGFWAANQIPWFAGAHGSQFLKISIGILGGVIPLLVWGLQTWYLVSGKEQLAKRLRNGILIGIGAIVFSLLVVFLIQLYLFGQIAPINRDHVVIYNRLWKAMDRAYPYFDEKGVDWDVVYDKYLPEVEEAGSSDAFYQAISRMLLTLEDSHTGLLSPPANIRCCFGLVSEIEGQAVVTLPGRIAQEAGIETGAILLEVGGRSIESALKDLPPRLTHGSTDWLNRANSFDLLLSTGREAEKLEVRFQDLSGEEHRVDLVWPDENTPTGGGSQIISSKKLESGIGYIQIEVFGNSPETDLVEAFDQALNDLWDCPGLIVDLRGNRGGNSALGDQIAGRFYKNKTLYGKETFPARLAIRGFIQRGEHSVEPRGPFYDKPIVLLIDHQTISSGEYFVVAMADSGRAQTVGRRTAGASGNPLTFKLGGEGLARYSTGDFQRLNGQSIEGNGIEPEIRVVWTIEDVRKGIDPDILKAEELIQRN